LIYRTYFLNEKLRIKKKFSLLHKHIAGTVHIFKN